jgi:hypothetical protein
MFVRLQSYAEIVAQTSDKLWQSIGAEKAQQAGVVLRVKTLAGRSSPERLRF